MEETDREMLELAARAMGLDVVGNHPAGGVQYRGADGGVWVFDSLNRDGDALRLAVKLGIAVYPPEADGDDATVNGPYPLSNWHSETVTDDPCAATRRAITRAAAEIGRAM